MQTMKAANRRTIVPYAVQSAAICMSAKAVVKQYMDMAAILIITSIAMSAAMNVRFAKKGLSVCRASELPVPVSGAEFALPAMSR